VPPDLDLAQYGGRLTEARLTRVIGDRDQYIQEAQVSEESARLDAAGVKYELRRFAGGHLIPWNVLQDLIQG
jgi:predicted esterase